MTTATTWSIDGTQTPASVARRMLAGLIGTAGVDADGALAVSERAAAANNSWDIAAGGAFFVIDGEVWHAWWDDTNIPATPADPDNARIDLVIAEVRDDGVNKNAILRTVTGVAAADPDEPAAPAGSVVLARADVPLGVGTMIDAYLTDRRPAAAVKPAVMPTAAAPYPLGQLGRSTRATGFQNAGPAYSSIGVNDLLIDVGATTRNITIEALVLLQADVTACRADARLTVDAAQVEAASNAVGIGSADRASIYVRTTVPLSGSHTFGVQVGRSGTDTIDLIATATAPAWLRVVDDGPA